MTGSIAPVAVIGGGLAGATTCLALHQAGIPPLWVAPPMPDVDKPGEHLAPSARAILQSLGAADLIDRPCHRQSNTVFSSWGSDRLIERHSMIHLEGPAVVLNRRQFEADMVGLARGKVSCMLRVAAVAVERAGGGWIVRTPSQELAVRFVIDATGRASVVGRKHAAHFRADQLAAIVAFFEQKSGAEVEPSKATLIEASRDGWWYATLLPDNRMTLNYYTDADLLPAAADRQAVVEVALRHTQYIHKWIEETGFRMVKPLRTYSAGTTWLAPAAGADWAAVGDAAAAFDPLSSHGMTAALWTSVTAAKAAVAALEGDSRPLAAYAARVAEGVQSFLVSQRAVYDAEQRYADSEFWARRHAGKELRMSPSI